jgi:3-oxoacyl-(acyl-carrier-protein) synthase
MASPGRHAYLPALRDGQVRAMTLALEDAELQPGDIGYINAQDGHPHGDAVETTSVKQAFGAAERSPPRVVSSTKALTRPT